jgi:hypothetical protein
MASNARPEREVLIKHLRDEAMTLTSIYRLIEKERLPGWRRKILDPWVRRSAVHQPEEDDLSEVEKQALARVRAEITEFRATMMGENAPLPETHHNLDAVAQQMAQASEIMVQSNCIQDIIQIVTIWMQDGNFTEGMHPLEYAGVLKWLCTFTYSLNLFLEGKSPRISFWQQYQIREELPPVEEALQSAREVLVNLRQSLLV